MTIQKRTDILGRDLMALYRVTDGRHEDIDIEREDRYIRGAVVWDMVTHEGVENAVQAVIHRIKTVKGIGVQTPQNLVIPFSFEEAL